MLQLREMLLEHHNCGCETVQRYVRSVAGALADTGGQLGTWTHAVGRVVMDRRGPEAMKVITKHDV